MIVLTAADIAALLPMPEAVDVIADCMVQVSARNAELPLRFVVPVGGPNRFGVMAGALGEPQCYGVKLLSLFPGNPAKGFSSHRGAVMVFEPETGAAVAMMEADLLTAKRTAAASGVATRALARPDAARLSIIGYGEQAEHHLDAMLAVRPVARVHVAGRDAARAEAVAEKARARHPSLDIHASDDIEAAVREAEILCTVTASPTPIVKGEWLSEGCHVNVVGSSIPTMREVDDAFVLRGAIWVDYLPSTLAQAGEIVDMIQAGTFSADAIRAEIGAVLAGDAAGRESDDQVTVYRSLGVATQDLAAAWYVYRAAAATGRAAARVRDGLQCVRLQLVRDQLGYRRVLAILQLLRRLHRPAAGVQDVLRRRAGR